MFRFPVRWFSFIRHGAFVCVGLSGHLVFSAEAPVEAPALRQLYADDFLLGCALSPIAGSPRSEEALWALAAKQFDAITPENHMKPALVHPEEKNYDFAISDRMVEFAQRHEMAIIGHTLVWHHQTPAWFFQTADEKPASRELILQRLHEHINTLMTRYRGKIKGWDVVNEAIERSADGKGRIRQNTNWCMLVGEDYIEKAFEFAHSADPGAELYYNDFEVEQPWKRQTVVRLVKQLKAKGLRIDGVGIQGHWRVNTNLKEIEDTIIALGACGVKVAITELDIDVLPHKKNTGADLQYSEKWEAKGDIYRTGCPPEILSEQARMYADLFKIFLKHKQLISRVTFWGITDRYTWLNNWPVKGRVNHPLLFDRDFQPKPAFFSLVNLKAGGIR